MQPRNLTPQDAALMGLPVLDHGNPGDWEDADHRPLSLDLLFLPDDDDRETDDYETVVREHRLPDPAPPPRPPGWRAHRAVVIRAVESPA